MKFQNLTIKQKKSLAKMQIESVNLKMQACLTGLQEKFLKKKALEFHQKKLNCPPKSKVTSTVR